MFGSKKTKTTDHSSKTLRRDAAINGHNQVVQGTIITGEVTCEGDIRIDGKLEGHLSCKSKVVIGATGIITGDIICRNADISGTVEGTIRVTELLHLKKTARLKGDILTQKLVVDEGAVFDGSSRMDLKGDFTVENYTANQLNNATVGRASQPSSNNIATRKAKGSR